MKSIEPYILNYKKNVLSIPPLKEWAFRTIICKDANPSLNHEKRKSKEELVRYNSFDE